MLSTAGVILMACVALLSSLITVITSKWLLAARARRASSRASAATQEEKAPPKWESRLRELETEVVSLSSAFEKVTKQLMRLNSRAGMRELRAESSASEAPPVGAAKSELRKYYGVNGMSGPQQAAMQLTRESQ